MATQIIRDDTKHPAQMRVVQIESTCYPYAEAGDLVELQDCQAFNGDGVYALEYRREARPIWSGLRRMRSCSNGVEIEEGRGWTLVGPADARVISYVGKVGRVWHSAAEYQTAANAVATRG